MQRVLVTGATGFIGRALAVRLARDGHAVRGTSFRSAPPADAPAMEWCSVGSIGADTDWSEALSGIDAVVHVAGLAHAKGGTDVAAAAREVNTRGTLRLASSAADRGIARIVFLSSIGVLGSRTCGQAFSEESAVEPHGPYARSKYEAEEGLREIAARGAIDVVVVRAPLVYGAEAPGNFRRLVGLVRSGLPLPLGAIRNARSLIAVENLADVLTLCLQSPEAACGTFLVCDGEDLSTPDLLRLIAHGLGVRLQLLGVPPALLALAGRMLGRADDVEKLCDSLCIDSRKVRERLCWQPPVRAAEAVVAAARGYGRART